MTGLTKDQIESYGRDGILFPFPVLSEVEVAAALVAFAALDEQPEALRHGMRVHKSFKVSKILADMCRSPQILDRVEGVIGPNILAWGAGFFAKPPRSGAFVSWHQDSTYWGLDPADVVTAWVALTPSTVESGCMRVAPGTHLTGQLAHRETWEGDNLLSRGQEIAVDVKLDQIVDVVLQPGEMSLHHVRIAHNSEPNRSPLPRIGFAIRYVAAHVRQTKAARDRAMMVRGEDRWKYFDHEDGATGEYLAEEVARHAQDWAASHLAPAKPGS